MKCVYNLCTWVLTGSLQQPLLLVMKRFLEQEYEARDTYSMRGNPCRLAVITGLSVDCASYNSDQHTAVTAPHMFQSHQMTSSNVNPMSPIHTMILPKARSQQCTDWNIITSITEVKKHPGLPSDLFCRHHLSNRYLIDLQLQLIWSFKC